MPDDPLDVIAVEICLAEGFRFGEFEGEGAFKRTYKIFDGKGEMLALKIVDPTKSSLDRTEREIDALKRCSSPRLSRYHSSGQHPNPNGAITFLIEEFFTEGTLSDKLSAEGTVGSTEIIKYGAAITQAIAELKRLDLVHRDIKPDNIMFRRGDPVPVLTDFGLVRNLGETSLTPSWQPLGPGTPLFSAPEQLNNDKALIGWRTDQFSMALVLGFCLTGRHAFRESGMSDQDAVRAVAERKQISAEFASIAGRQNLRQLITALSPWPVSRFSTIQELSDAFK